MKKLILLFFLNGLLVYSQSFPFKLSRADDKNVPFKGGNQNSVCESRVKVSDERPSDCNFGNQYTTLYPVLIEEFDFKEELPNNWGFNNGYTSDDNYDLGANIGWTWMGTSQEAYDNNLTVNGGMAHLIWKKEYNSGKIAYDNASPRNYEFTGAVLTSKYKTREGIVKAIIKLPENNTMWPAFWKLGGQEIDIFEFWDDKIQNNPISNCETYHQMKMHMYGSYNNTDCVRGRKFPVKNSFFDTNHTYQSTFTDYRLDIFLDGTLVGYANKYYEGPYTPSPPCYKHTESGVAQSSHGCGSMQNLVGCSLEFPGTPPEPDKWPNWLPWPYIAPYCMVYNKVDKDEAFPKTNVPMDVRISNAFRNEKNRNSLYNSWSNFSDVDKEIAVDRVEVWEQINCYAIHNLCSINDFNNATGYTSFLAGSNIILSNNSSSCNFINSAPTFANKYLEYPLHLLATDEIAFKGGDIIIEEGTYLRAEIINCNGQSFTQRTTSQSPSYAEVSEEEIQAIEKQQTEDFIKNNPVLADSLFKSYKDQLYNESINADSKIKNHPVSATDNGSIILYPNPTNDIINIDMVEEDYNDILYIEVLNNLGQTMKMEKAKQINLSEYSSGMYQIKFVFSHGFIVVKSISKQ